MASATLVSIEQYLSTTYHPDCDYVDGQVLERNLGEFEQSKLQASLTIWFGIREREWNVHVLTEQRFRVSRAKFRIPDVCLISREQTIERVFARPPLLCIEVLSPEDTLRSLRPRIDDYLGFGVPNIWLIDSTARRGYTCSEGSIDEVQSSRIEVPASPIFLDLHWLFANLD